MCFRAVLALVAFTSTVCHAREPSDLTATLLSRSTAVIAVEFHHADGIYFTSGNNYLTEHFKVTATLSGTFSDEIISVSIVRSKRDEVHLYRPGEKLILFVCRRSSDFPPWALADDDFGAQPYTHGLEESIKQLMRDH